jgi:hypothetical protein
MPGLLLPLSLAAQLSICQSSAKAAVRFEIRQAEEYRHALLATAKLFSPDSSFPEAEETFQTLITDSTITDLHLPFRWRLNLVESTEVNAFSFPDGEVLVTRPLAMRLGHSRGLWAAVLSHELSHIAGQHWFKRYCQWEGEQNRGEALPGVREDVSVSAELNPLQAGPGAVFSREQELEADRQGMLLMAHAGYNPEFFFALNHLLKALPGQDSLHPHLASHPGWEERDHAGRDQSIQADWVFEDRWPEGSSPPGGAPPMVVFFSEPTANGEQAMIDVQCRNPEGPMEVVFLAWDPKVASGRRPLVRMSSSRILKCVPITEVAIPLDWSAVRSRKLEARFAVFSANHTVLEYSRSFLLRVPR